VSRVEGASVEEALDHLVNQFADPLSFLRELIQNSIDAGSQHVDVRFEKQPGQDGECVMVIHVDDFGEGMDREIIDSRLTRLFSSGKDGDLTKIGKFGIGFSSVFAIQPDAVCIDTTRGGENWRVLFRKDRSFVRIERDEPIEGTKIRLIKAVPEAVFEDYRARAESVVRYWCKHVEVEVTFDGEVINEPFDIDLRVKVFHHEPGTDIVAGYARGEATFRGFYNKGLTLLETDDSGVPRVSFKVSSRYLEHTLTRDRVIEDANYHKAMSLVDGLIAGPLIERLFELLDEAVRTEGENLSRARYLQELAAWHLARGTDLPASVGDRAVLRSVDGAPLGLTACRRAAAAARLLVETGVSPLTDALAAQGYVIVSQRSDGGGLLRTLCGGEPPHARHRFCLPLPVASEDETLRWVPLRDAAADLLGKSDVRIASLELGRLAYEGSGVGSWPVVTVRRLGEVTPLAEALTLGTSLLSRKRVLVVSSDHPTVQGLIGMARTEPELAALVLAKLVLLMTKHGPAVDAELASPALNATLGKLAVERRCTRLGF
jgi:hypothetical protein